MHADVLERISKDCIAAVERFHHAQPQSPGIEKEALLQSTGLQKAVSDGILEHLLQQDQLVIRKDRIASPAHSEQFDPAQQALLEKIEAVFQKHLFSPPKIEELAAQIRHSLSDVQKTIQLLVEQKRLMRVEQDMYFSTEAIEQAKQRIAEHIQEEGQGSLESVKFKYLVDTTRKYALPLLDYMDKIGFTRRIGNTRYLK